jgi:O-antigen/teichoic acid export membrane protein
MGSIYGAMVNKSSGLYIDFVRKVSSVFFNKIFLIIIGFFSSVLTTRLLGAEGRGVWAVTMALAATIGQFCNLGMQSANTYYISEDQNVTPLVIGNLIVTIIFSIVLSGVYYVICLLFPQIAPIGNKALLIAVMFVPLQLAFMLQQNIFIAINHIKNFNFFELLNGSCFPLFLFIFSLFFSVFVERVLIISILAHGLILLLGLFNLIHLLPYRIKIDRCFFKKCLSFGIKVYISNILWGLVRQINIFVVNHFHGLAETGQFSLAFSLVEYINIIHQSVGLIFFPMIIKMKTREEQYKTIKNIMIMTMGVLSVVVVSAILFSPYFIPFVYGDEFAESVFIFRILSLNVLIIAPGNLLSIFFNSQKKLNFVIFVYFLGALFAIVFTIIGNIRWGITGTAIAFLGSNLFISFLFVMKFLKERITENAFELG